MWMEPGSVVEMAPPGGGGFGEPFKRDPNAVLQDVVNGYVTIDAAREDYGVAINYVGDATALVRTPVDYQVDEVATGRLRSSKI